MALLTYNPDIYTKIAEILIRNKLLIPIAKRHDMGKI